MHVQQVVHVLRGGDELAAGVVVVLVELRCSGLGLDGRRGLLRYLGLCFSNERLLLHLLRRIGGHVHRQVLNRTGTGVNMCAEGPKDANRPFLLLLWQYALVPLATVAMAAEIELLREEGRDVEGLASSLSMPVLLLCCAEVEGVAAASFWLLVLLMEPLSENEELCVLLLLLLLLLLCLRFIFKCTFSTWRFTLYLLANIFVHSWKLHLNQQQRKEERKSGRGVVYAVPAPCANYEQKSLLLQVLHVPELGLGPRVGLLVVVLDVDVVLELVLAREVLGAERAHVLALKETLRD